MENKTFLSGIESIYGKNGLTKLQSSHFLVLGIGGVGSWIAESLVRTGAGEITLVDLDDICVSNINRQVHALHSTVGQLKIEAIEARLKDINPQVKINLVFDFITKENYQTLLGSNKYTYIFDAIDSLKNKCLIVAYCKENKLPLITIGAAGGKKDATKIMVRDLNRTINDKLLARMKKVLRKNFNFTRYHDRPYKIPAVFSSETVIYNEDSATCEFVDSSKQRKNCETGYGSLTHMTASFGLFAVSYVINDIINE